MLRKQLLWVGSALSDLRQFPPPARRRAGRELGRLQEGLSPKDFKPIPTVGLGTCELRIRTLGAFRVFYVTRFEEGIYVLHAFQKKSRRTSRADLEIGSKRYREAIASRGRP